jgi:processing peptidase subunit beta
MASACVRVGFGVSKVLARSNRKSLALLPHRWATHAATYEDVLTVPETKVTTLKNLLRVASEETNAHTATVGLWFDTGSRYETKKTNGVAHFLEHLTFKGTGKRSALDLETEFENHGMHLNSHVSRDQMAFYAKCLAKDVPKAVEILADLIQNGTYSEADIDKVRGDILREMQEDETNQTTVVLDYLHATAFQGTSLSNPVIGNTETVKSITRNDLTNFAGTHFKPPRMVLAGAGAVNHRQLAELGEKHFGNMSLNYEREIPTLPPSRFTGSEIRARDDDLPLAHVALAIQGPGYSNPDSIPLAIASALIGSWDTSIGAGANASSRLASASAQAGLCDSFQSFSTSYHDTGLWGIYFASDKESILDMTFNVQGEWMRLCSSITDFEVERAKNLYKTNLFNQLDGSTPICEDIGRQVIYLGRRIPLDELNYRIDAVSAKTIRDVCFKYIYDKCPALASVGPVEQLPDYNRIRGSMFWLRL